MKYKNALVEVLKQNLLAEDDKSLLSKNAEELLYPSPSTPIDDIIDNEKSFLNVNSDAIFGRNTPPNTTLPQLFTNNSTSSKKNAVSFISANIKKDIDIVPTNFNKITEKENTYIVPAPVFELTEKNQNTTDPIIFDNIEEENNTKIISDPIPKSIKIPVVPFDIIPEPAKVSSISFNPISESTEIPSIPFNPIPESTDIPSVPFNPIPESTEIPVVPFNTITKSVEVPSIPFNPIPESTEIPVVPFNPIPESTEIPVVPFNPIPESTEIPVVPFDSFSGDTKNVNITEIPKQELSILPNSVIFPEENQETINSPALFSNNRNSVHELKERSFQRKFKNGTYTPSESEIGKIKRILFRDMIGSNTVQNKLTSDLRQIPAFAKGAVFESNNVGFQAFVHNEPGSSNETHTIQPNDTPVTTLTRVGSETNKSTLDLKTELLITESIAILNDKIQKVKESIPNTGPSKEHITYPHNQIRDRNMSIMTYYDSFL